MPRKPCYWTRKLELDLVEFVKQNDFIWRSVGNTNHHIQQKYKAYAEFASRLGRGFTARSVRDRWVNIRSTFNHNLRKVDKSKEAATSPEDVYVPCWPLWRPLQFLCEVSRKEVGHSDDYSYLKSETGYHQESQDSNVKLEDKALSRKPLKQEDFLSDSYMDIDQIENLLLRQTGKPSKYPKLKGVKKKKRNEDCLRVVDELVTAMEPIISGLQNDGEKRYCFFGKHVAERLNSMRKVDAASASREIMYLLEEYTKNLM